MGGGVLLLLENNELVLLSHAMERCNVSTIKSMVLAWFLFESSIESKALATIQPLPFASFNFPHILHTSPCTLHETITTLKVRIAHLQNALQNSA